MVSLQHGLVLTIFLVTINAFLLFGSGQVGIARPTSDLDTWMPQSMLDFNGNYSADLNKNKFTSATDDNGSIFTSSAEARATIGYLKDLPARAFSLLAIMVNLLTYHMTFMQTIGVPYAVAWLIGVPITLLMLIVLVLFIIEIIKAVSGILRG